MIEFIVRARATPVLPDEFRNSIGAGVGTEYLADIFRSTLFISQGHRSDCQLSLVLEKSRDYSRVVSIVGELLGSVPDLHETGLLRYIEAALNTGIGLRKDEVRQHDTGCQIRATSFEHLVKDRAAHQPVYLLKPSGPDIREVELEENAVFVMTDHTPMPSKTFKSMARQGVQDVSIGPTMLHASQGIAIVLNELDRRHHKG